MINVRSLGELCTAYLTSIALFVKHTSKLFVRQTVSVFESVSSNHILIVSCPLCPCRVCTGFTIRLVSTSFGVVFGETREVFFLFTFSTLLFRLHSAPSGFRSHVPGLKDRCYPNSAIEA